jgi:hypothetical protein
MELPDYNFKKAVGRMKTIRRKINLEGMIGNYLKKSKLKTDFKDIKWEFEDKMSAIKKNIFNSQKYVQSLVMRHQNV